MYKVKIVCNELLFNGNKITKKNANEIIQLLKVNSYGYINSCVFVHKTYNKYTAGNKCKRYIQKSLELFTNQPITAKQLLKMISKLHKIGTTCVCDLKCSKINYIDVSNNATIFGYDFHKNPIKIKARTGNYKNRSKYFSHILFKKQC